MTEEIISLSLPLHVSLTTERDHICVVNGIWKVLFTQGFRGQPSRSHQRGLVPTQPCCRLGLWPGFTTSPLCSQFFGWGRDELSGSPGAEGSPTAGGQDPPAQAHPTTPARSRAPGGQWGSTNPGHQAIRHLPRDGDGASAGFRSKI